MSGRLLYVVTEPWYFANHRLDHARALMAADFDVHVATRRGDRWDELVDAGCTVHEVDLGRGSGSIRGWVGELRAVRKVVKAVEPDVVHAVALKPVAVTLSLLASLRRPALILSVNGLGISAASGDRRTAVIGTVIRSAARAPRVELLFQTVADQRAVTGGTERGVVIPGVGVDVDRFRPLERPATPPVIVAYLGRAVKSKGLTDLARYVADSPVPGVEIHLYCALDDSSPGALDEDDLAMLRNAPGVVVHEPTRQPEAVLGSAHAAILPSRAGEGVSKFVLEALACGAPVVLSAQSGSGEAVVPGETGLTFDVADPQSVTSALGELLTWSDDRWAEMRASARADAVANYSLDVILPRIIELHRNAIGSRS